MTASLFRRTYGYPDGPGTQFYASEPLELAKRRIGTGDLHFRGPGDPNFFSSTWRGATQSLELDVKAYWRGVERIVGIVRADGSIESELRRERKLDEFKAGFGPLGLLAAQAAAVAESNVAMAAYFHTHYLNWLEGNELQAQALLELVENAQRTSITGVVERLSRARIDDLDIDAVHSLGRKGRRDG